MSMFAASNEYKQIDPKRVKIWQHFPVPDEFGDGVFVAYDKERDVHDGRYIVVRRDNGSAQVTHIAYVIEKTWARRAALLVASVLNVPVSLVNGGPQKEVPRSWGDGFECEAGC